MLEFKSVFEYLRPSGRAALLLVLLACAACRKEPQADTQARPDSVAGQAQSAATEGRTDSPGTPADPAAAAGMSWRAFIDPGLTIEQIEVLDEQQALDRLAELGVPFTADNFHESIEMDPLELTALFLQAGMPVESVNANGVTALQAAAAQGKLEHMRLLLRHGADPELQDAKFHGTAVDFAINGGSLAALQILLDSGADINGGPETRPNLIDAVASGNEDMFDFILARFPDVNVRDGEQQDVLMNACLSGSLRMVQRLVEAGADIESTEPLGGTPLAAAAFSGNWDALRYLIDRGADPQTLHRGHRNLLYEFAAHPDFPQDLAQQFIDKGMDPDQAADASLTTPLMLAVQNNNLAMLSLLLENGADTGLQDAMGLSALDYALQEQNAEIISLFSAYGISLQQPPA